MVLNITPIMPVGTLSRDIMRRLGYDMRQYFDSLVLQTNEQMFAGTLPPRMQLAMNALRAMESNSGDVAG